MKLNQRMRNKLLQQSYSRKKVKLLSDSDKGFLKEVDDFLDKKLSFDKKKETKKGRQLKKVPCYQREPFL